MKKFSLILLIILFGCSKNDLDDNFRKVIIEYQKKYPIINHRKGRVYIYSAMFYKDNNDTIMYLTRGSGGISKFTVKDNFTFGVYSDDELQNLIITDSLKLSRKLVLNYKRVFTDSLINDNENAPESITPLATYKLKDGFPKLVKIDTIWNHWD